MRPSLALSVGAVAATALGIPLALLPAQMLSAFGLAAPTEALILSRDAGVLLIGLGIIDWMARNAIGAPLRGLLWGNVAIRVGEIVNNGWAIATGMIPSSAAAGLILPVALIVIFLLALRRPESKGDGVATVPRRP
jgi:hypothetical protein